MVAVNELLQFPIRLSQPNKYCVLACCNTLTRRKDAQNISESSMICIIEKPALNSSHRKIDFNLTKKFRRSLFSSQEFGRNVCHHCSLVGDVLKLQVYHDNVRNKTFCFFFSIKQRNWASDINTEIRSRTTIDSLPWKRNRQFLIWKTNFKGLSRRSKV